MPKGVLVVHYQLVIPDFEVLDPGPFVQRLAGPPPWTATLRPSEAGCELLIEIETDDPSAASQATDVYAQRITEHFVFCLCDYDISQTVTARRLGSPSFQSSAPNTLHVFLGELVLAGEAVTARITNRVKGKEIADALASFSLREAAPTPAFANDLVIARQMYLAGRQVDNAVARFLIVYAALAVFATFKLSTGRLQTRIDAVLKNEDPTVPMHPVPPPRAPGVESEFTRARNTFIHAEDRGRDPGAAMAAIESLAPKFQRLVGRILRKG